MRVETIVRPPLPPRPKTMINARAFEPLPEAAWAALRADLAPLLPLGRGNRRQRGEARSWEEAAADFTRRGRAYLKLLPPWEELHLASRLPWGTPDPPLVTVWGRLGEWVPAPAAQAVADQFIGRPGWDLVEVCTYTRTFSLLEPWPDGFPVRFGVAPAWGTWYGPALVAQLGPERVAGIPAAIVAPRAGGWWVQLTADPADPAGQPGGAVAEAVRAYWGPERHDALTPKPPPEPVDRFAPPAERPAPPPLAPLPAELAALLAAARAAYRALGWTQPRQVWALNAAGPAAVRQQLAALPVPEGVEAALRAPRAGPARSRVQVRRFWAGWMLGAFLGDSALQLAGVQDPAAGAGDGPRWGWHPEGGAVAIGPMPGYFPVAFP
ncbi:MAG: hypothetical protein OWV35_07590, partial [Firmicutes bacterium]|nr:hypothetical protein [Bacillota bacterium]